MPQPTPPAMPPEDRHTIFCLYCHRPQDVARRAISITCKFCHKPLKLEDIAIKSYEARREIATCGSLTVEKRGSAITDSILCGSLIARGKIRGTIESRGLVSIGPDAHVTGNITAPTLAVLAGAILDGFYQIGPPTPTLRPRRMRTELRKFDFCERSRDDLGGGLEASL